MSLRLLALALLAGGCAASASRQAPMPALTDLAERGRQVNFGVGQRSFTDRDFGELDDQVAWTLDYCEPIELGALRLEGGLHYTYDDAHGTSGGQDVHLHGRTFEMSAGLNYSHLLGRLRPYVGGGGALLFLNQRGINEDTDTVFQDDDVGVGAYVKAGVLFQVSPTSHIGFEFRHFEGSDVSFDGTDLGTDYDQVLIVYGTSFYRADMPPPPP